MGTCCIQELQSSLLQHQPRVQQLSNDLLLVQQLVARSRPGVSRQHPDVQQLETAVDDVTSRWENLSINANDR